jgi:hypothetical protein
VRATTQWSFQGVARWGSHGGYSPIRTVEDGHRYSLCNYRDVEGNYYIDRYVDGEYVGES